MKAYRKANPDKIKAYYKTNEEKFREQSKAYGKAHRPQLSMYAKANHNRRYHSDGVYKLKHLYRGAIRRGFKKISCGKDVQSLDCLGCSWKDFLSHIASQFYDRSETGEKMTLEKHGVCGWHLDHITPISTAKTKEDVIRLSHYTNFQPLWAEENMSKSNKII